MSQPPPITHTVHSPAVDEGVLVRAAFESAPDALVVLDASGRMLTCNARFLALWQFPAAMLARRDPVEMRAHTAAQLQDPQRYLMSIPAVVATAESGVFDELALRDGRVFARHVSPLAAAGVRGGVVVRWRDITQRHRAEQSLLQSQARLAAVFEHAINAILLAGDDGHYVDANPAACVMLGYSHGELLALAVHQLVVPGSMDVDGAWSGFLREGSSRGRVCLRRKDGSVVVAQFNAVAHMLPGLHLSILSDVTEEVHNQQRQQELSALLDLAMVGAGLAYWEVDLLAGRVSSVNSHWHTMLGYTNGEIAPNLQAWYDLVHPDDAAHRAAAWEAHVSGAVPTYEAEFRMRHKDGHWVWLQARGRTVARDAQGRATRVVGMRMDISARKRAEQFMESLAHTDSLTGIFNRRRFMALAGDELLRASRHGQPTALLMIDLDHFKRINDNHGHAAGDDVLCEFVRAAGEVVRQTDVFARVGGEEFAVLLPLTGFEGAFALAQRLLQGVQAAPARVGGVAVPYTVSIGVAVMAAPDAGPAGPAALQALMRAADEALYTAKTQGRNRVLMAPAVT